MLRASNAGAIGKTIYNELRLQWLSRRRRVRADQRGAGGAGAERVQLRRRAARRLARLEHRVDHRRPRHRDRPPRDPRRPAARRRPLSHQRAPQHRPARSRSRASTPTTPASRRPSRETSAIRDVEISQAQLGLYVQDDYPRAQGPDDQRRPAAGVSVAHRRPQPRRRAAASRGRRSRAARRRSAAAAASSSTGSTRWPTNRRVQLDGTHQQIETIVQPGLSQSRARRPGGGAAAGRVQFAAEPGPAAADRSDRRDRADAAGRRAGQHDVHPPARHRTSCAASTSTRRSPAGCGPIRRRARSPRFSRSPAPQFDAISVNLNYQRHAAAALPRRQLHVRPIRSTTPTARSACRPTATTSPPSAGRRSASRATGS